MPAAVTLAKRLEEKRLIRGVLPSVYLPLPPPNVDDMTVLPRLEFSYVECLMYAFHKLLRQCPDFLTEPERMKDFKLRLQYFARGMQVYIKKLREALTGKNAQQLKSEDNKLKVVALKTTSNINILIRDLFHNPPSFKSIITLSWKPTGGKNKQPVMEQEPGGVKRHTPITFEDESAPSKQKKIQKESKEIYIPPGGKYSNRVTSFGTGRAGRSRGREGSGAGPFRAGGRGKFRGRNWWRPSY